MIRQLLLIACLGVIAPTLAQEDPAETSHWRKAEEMFMIAGGSDVIDAMMLQLDAKLELEVEMMRHTLTEEYFMGPEIDEPLDKYAESIKQIMQDIFNLERYKELVVPLYMANFTEAELDQIIAFYKSPIGRTMTEKLPSIMIQSQALGEELGMEFAQAMQPVLKELETSIGLIQ